MAGIQLLNDDWRSSDLDHPMIPLSSDFLGEAERCKAARMQGLGLTTGEVEWRVNLHQVCLLNCCFQIFDSCMTNRG